MKIYTELSRRNVFRVGIAYAVASWVLLQIVDVISPIFELPAWAPKLIFVILAIGLVPGYATIGWAAPILVLILRLLQGLALGGEYGGAATYVAEHAPAGQRGFWTSWIQTTATLGLFLDLVIIILITEPLSAS